LQVVAYMRNKYHLLSFFLNYWKRSKNRNVMMNILLNYIYYIYYIYI